MSVLLYIYCLSSHINILTLLIAIFGMILKKQTNEKAKSLINSILKDEINKKNNTSEFKLTNQTLDTNYACYISDSINILS
jgi:hypothetical protein